MQGICKGQGAFLGVQVVAVKQRLDGKQRRVLAAQHT